MPSCARLLLLAILIGLRPFFKSAVRAQMEENEAIREKAGHPIH